MKLHVVEYSVPVLVFVNVEDGEVVKVHIDEEELSSTNDVYSEDFETTLEMDDPVRLKAIFITEATAWPGWPPRS